MHTSGLILPVPAPPPRHPRGFTLVELLIATVVLAVGLIALTSAGAAIVKLEGRGQQLSRIAAAGETRLELLRSQRCEGASGTGIGGQLEERWSVTQGATRTLVLVDSILRDAAGGVEPRNVHAFWSAVRC